MKKIYDVLLVDHQHQRNLAEKLVDTSGDSKERARLFKLLKDEARAHANAEEQTLYAALIADERSQPESRHSVTEHQKINKLIDELDTTDRSSPGWLATARDLRHAIEHHLDEEEEDVFKLARSILTDEEAVSLALEFSERKQSELGSADP